MSLFTSLYNARSGLHAAQAGIGATSHNVSNSLTPGYNRRNVQQSVNAPIRDGKVWIGTGTSVDAIARNADSLLGMQQIAQSGTASSANTLSSDLSAIEAWFDESSNAGPRLSLGAFFDAMTSATADPADPGLRSGVIYSGTAMAESISGTSRALQSALATGESRVMAGISDMNQQINEIAKLNLAIESGGGSLEMGDLADRRDLAIRNIAELAGVTANLQPDGQATVFVGGHAVVNGSEGRMLTVDNSGPGIPRVRLEVDTGSVNVNNVLSGEIGGHLDAYNATSGYIDDLNTFTVDFATAMNTQHAAGFDLNDTPGGDLFTFDPLDPAATMSFSSAITEDSDLLAFAGASPALAGDGDNLIALMDLEDQLVVGGSRPGDFLSGLTSRVGSDVASADLVASRQSQVVADLDELASNLSGVDMDEEAANLITYQTAYQAAAKVMQVTDSMLGILMDLA